jgi:hypothetical protein
MMMPEKRTMAKARKDKRAGKAPTTQAGEFVHEEIRKIRRGEHGARSPQQAIAIGLSKARRAGVALRPPRKGQAKARTRRICLCRGSAQAQNPPPAARLACGIAGSQARTAPHRVAARALAPSPPRRRAPFGGCAFRRRTQGDADERLCRPLRRGT